MEEEKEEEAEEDKVKENGVFFRYSPHLNVASPVYSLNFVSSFDVF